MPAFLGPARCCRLSVFARDQTEKQNSGMMKIAIVAPSPKPFVVGGAEKLWWGLLEAINQGTPHDADLIKLPSPERSFAELIASYRRFSRLDLDHFDLVISTKYPAWMLSHRNHCCYIQHRLRGLYDTYHLTGLPTTLNGMLGEMPLVLRRFALRLQDAPGLRAELEPFFEEVQQLSARAGLARFFAFPGPLSRAVIHYLDRIALAPMAIQRYCAISHNVAQRADYFPADVPVSVIHHPSDLRGLHCAGYRHVFTASRLTQAKRIDLIIRAFKQVRGDLELRIAGTGPQREELERLAASDRRIRFLGHVSDTQMVEEYANALFVPFVPYDEDYGLITVEAMACAKPVLTVEDAGGVNELVEDGVTGRSVAVDPEGLALARAMQALVSDPAATRAMGERAQARVAAIRWPQTVTALLAPPPQSPPFAPLRRPKVVIAVDFPVFPPRGGGQARVYHLYKALARRADCVLVTLCNDAAQAGRYVLAPALSELRIAKSDAHRDASRELDGELRASAGDIATLMHIELTPAYAQALAAEVADCDLLIASHPYLYPAIAGLDVSNLWYEAHNVEYDMKRAVLGSGAAVVPYLDRVRAAEGALCARADAVLVCAQRDAGRLAELYGIAEDVCVLAPNGVDAGLTPFVGATPRVARREALRLARPALIFIGSWHQPNIEAVGFLRRLATELPGCDLLVVGSVCRHQVMQERPPNLHALGLLDDAELEVLLGAVELALNPITAGSGTNLKMLHYAAAGVPVLSTPFGVRGLCFAEPEHLWVASLEDFAAVAGQILALAPETREQRTAAARACVEQFYDWRIIAGALPLPAARQ